MNTLAEKTYMLLRQVPKGRVTTYKALAEGIGSKAYRVIGQLMRTNPYAPEVPCHRVVASNGTIGGFMGKTTGVEIKNKIALLQNEGVKVFGNKIVDFARIFYAFSK